MRFTRLVLAGILAAAAARALADPPSTHADLDVRSIVQMMEAGGGPTVPNAPDKPFPDFAEVTKGMKSAAGLFTLWSYPEDAKDKDGEKLLAQIPAGFLGEQFMLSTSIAGGGFLTGFPLDERVVRWELQDKQLVLAEPETQFVVDPGKEVSDVVQRTYPGRIRAAVPIVTKAPNGDPLIDLGAMLKGNFADLSFWAADPFLGGGLGAPIVNAALSTWTKRKTFELNVELGVALALQSQSPPGSFDKIMLHYSFWRLPKTDYQPRIADDRVGYFLTANQDWAKPNSARDIFNRYIDRWQLVKRDPSLESCEPRQPIIYYIEKTVPVKYRRAVRDGILEWNKAFEKCGYVNAVEVRQQTDDNEWKDLDPEDMRYSFFRWIVTGAGFAMGPHRANPFTGQIYDADIIFDDSMVRFYEQQAQRNLPSTAAMQRRLEDPVLRNFFQKYPQFLPQTRPWDDFVLGGDREARMRAALRARMEAGGLHACDYCEGMKHEMALAQTTLAGQPPEVIDRFLNETIKEVVMHEVGHTLGLRHNFIASSVYSLDEIQKRRGTGQATTGSVMDYNPALLLSKNATEGHFITPTIGAYDYWAIEYGYRPFEPGKAAASPDEPKKDKTEMKPAPALSGTAGGAEMKVVASTDGIPAEALEKMPPEVRAMLASGGITALGGAGAPGAAKPGATFATPPSGEEEMLAKIAGRATEPELAYATDEDTTYVGVDPRTNRFDCGADPIEWAQARIELVDKRMANILEWAVKDKESWYHLRAAFGTLISEKAVVLDYVGRYIGGQYFTRAHRGDKDGTVPFTLVESERQRAALAFVEQHAFNDQFYQMSAEVLNHLAPPRWYHDGATINVSMDFPVEDVISALQSIALFDRFFPNTLRRIHDSEHKTASADKLTAAEYIQRLEKACWSDSADGKRLASGTWNDASPFIPHFRRTLQREYLNTVEPLVRMRPGELVSPDLHAMLQFSMKKLSDDLDAQIKSGKADFASQAHLVACKSRIDRMLAPELHEFEPQPSAMMMMGRTAEKR